MKRNTLLILSAFILLLFTSCGKDDAKTGLMIPKDADMVVRVNTASLLSKMSWEELTKSGWFNKSSDDEKDSLVKKLLANPASSGIDLKTDITFFTKKQGNSRYMIVEGSLADASAFETVCKTLHKGDAAEVKKEKGFNYIASEHGAIVWTDKYFAFAGNSSHRNKGMKMTNTPDSLKLFGMEALTIDDKNNLQTDDRFTSLLKDGNDIHLWAQTANFSSVLGGVGSLLDLHSALEGSVSAVSINFENGKVSAKVKQYYGGKMEKLMSDFKGGPITAAAINRVPSSNVVAIAALNYPPAALKELLKITGKDAMAEMMLANLKTSTDDFIKSNKGELVLSLIMPEASVQKTNKVGKEENDEGLLKSTKGMKILLANSVNDEAAFGKVFSAIWEMAGKMKQRNGAADIKPLPFSYKLQNNWFAISNSSELTDKFLAGGDNKHPFTDKITGHPFGLYINVGKLMQAQFGGADTMIKKMLGNVITMWEDVVVTGGEYRDNATHFDIAVNFTDKNTNSLKQLVQFFSHIGNLFSGKTEVKEVTIEDITQEEDKEEPPPPPPPAKKKSNN